MEMPELVGRSELIGVDPVRVHATRGHEKTHGELGLPDELEISLQGMVRHPAQGSKAGAAFLVEFKAEWREQGAEKVVAKVTLSYRVAYRFKGLREPPSDDVLRAFANHVATHHAWPFLRERFRTLSVEMGLPPLLLPLKQLGQPMSVKGRVQAVHGDPQDGRAQQTGAKR